MLDALPMAQRVAPARRRTRCARPRTPRARARARPPPRRPHSSRRPWPSAGPCLHIDVLVGNSCITFSCLDSANCSITEQKPPRRSRSSRRPGPSAGPCLQFDEIYDEHLLHHSQLFGRLRLFEGQSRRGAHRSGSLPEGRSVLATYVLSKCLGGWRLILQFSVSDSGRSIDEVCC